MIDSTMEAGEEVVLRVGIDTNTTPLATRITVHLRSHDHVIVEAIGPVPISTALKSIALARIYCNREEFDLWMWPEFYVQPNRDRPGELTGQRLHIRRIEGTHEQPAAAS